MRRNHDNGEKLETATLKTQTIQDLISFLLLSTFDSSLWLPLSDFRFTSLSIPPLPLSAPSRLFLLFSFFVLSALTLSLFFPISLFTCDLLSLYRSSSFLSFFFFLSILPFRSSLSLLFFFFSFSSPFLRDSSSILTPPPLLLQLSLLFFFSPSLVSLCSPSFFLLSFTPPPYPYLTRPPSSSNHSLLFPDFPSTLPKNICSPCPASSPFFSAPAVVPLSFIFFSFFGASFGFGLA